MSLDSLRRWWPLAAAALLVALTAMAAANSSVRLRAIDSPPRPTQSAPVLEERDEVVAEEPTPIEFPDAQDGSESPPWFRTLLIGLGVALVLAIVVLLIVGALRGQARRRVALPPPDRAAGAAEEVVAAVDAGLEELSDTDRDPRRAVIACWVRLELAAAAAGTARQTGDTPTDLVTRLLREQRVDPRILAGFAEVYRGARYATHDVDERMRAAAIQALHRLRAELVTPVAAGTDGPHVGES